MNVVLALASSPLIWVLLLGSVLMIVEAFRLPYPRPCVTGVHPLQEHPSGPRRCPCGANREETPR